MRCSFDACEARVLAKTLCASHYQQARRGRNLSRVQPRKNRTAEAVLARDANGNKQCVRCSDWLPESDFPPAPRCRDGLHTQCRHCQRAARYGLTRDRLEQMRDDRQGVCPICERVASALVVDHDHSCCNTESGMCGNCVRGLICPSCNTLLGLARDEVPTLQNAIAYLNRHNHKEVAA